MSQKQKLHEYLKTHGEVNPWDAWAKLGIYRLSARIFDLRADGVDIMTTNTEDAKGKKVTIYRLVKR